VPRLRAGSVGPRGREDVLEIRDYIRRAKREPTREYLEEMWRAMFTLKAWYFLPAREEEGPNRPMVLELDGAPWLPVFTNVRRYRSFAEAVGYLDEGDSTHALMLDPGESLEQIREVEAAVEGVCFNPGSEVAVRAPVEALVEYARHFGIAECSG